MNNWIDTLGAICFAIVLFAMSGLIVAGLVKLLRSSKTKQLVVVIISGLTLLYGSAFAQTLQMGSQNQQHQDYSQPAYWSGSDTYFSERVAPPGSSMGSWNCGWGTWWTKMTHALGGGFWRVYQN
jgi:hypothetical protein